MTSFFCTENHPRWGCLDRNYDLRLARDDHRLAFGDVRRERSMQKQKMGIFIEAHLLTPFWCRMHSSHVDLLDSD